MNFGGEHSAHGLQFGQAPRGRRSGVPGWPSAPASRGPGGVATEDARRSERLTGNHRAEGHGQVMRVPRAGFPIDPPSGGRHRGTPAHARMRTGLRSISRAEQRVPAARNRQSCPAVVKTSDSSQTQGQNTRFFALSEAHTRTTDKNVRFPLPRPRKTVCFDRQRPKQTFFRIAPPGRRRRGARARVMPSGRRRGAGARKPHANDTVPSTVSPAC